jgi:hypothetical protein
MEPASRPALVPDEDIAGKGRSAGRSLVRDHWVFLAALLAIAVGYAPALGIHLIGDDFEWLNGSYGGWNDPGLLLTPIGGFFRPLVKLSYLIDYTLFATDSRAYAATNIVIHLCNIGLVYLLLVRVRRSVKLALLAAFMWGVSSVYSEATLWSAGRPDPIVLLPVLLLLIYASTAGRVVSRSQQVVSASLWLLAAGSKETWVVMPFVVLAFLVLVSRRSWRDALLWLTSGWVVLGGYLTWTLFVPLLSGHPLPTRYAGLGPGGAINKAAYAVAKLVGFSSLYEGLWWEAASVGLLVVATVVVLWRVGDGLARWGAIFFAATLAPTLFIEYHPSRYNYLPLLGLAVALSAGLGLAYEWLSARGWLRAGTALALASAAALCYGGYQVAMLQLDISDYRRFGEMHRSLVHFASRVAPQLRGDTPIVVINAGAFRGRDEMARLVRGHPKLLYPRQDAFWQLVEPAPLFNFVRRRGDPIFKASPVSDLRQLRAAEIVVVWFRDTGFEVDRVPRASATAWLGTDEKPPPRMTLLRAAPS